MSQRVRFSISDDPWKRPVLLARVYRNSDSAKEAAARLGCSARTVREWVRKTEGIRLRHQGRPRSEETTDPVRYTLENDRGYPEVEAWLAKDGERVRRAVEVHRLVAVAEWGYDAVADKEVHHRNGMKLDSRPENLVPLSKKRHAALNMSRRWDRPEVGNYEMGEYGPPGTESQLDAVRE